VVLVVLAVSAGVVSLGLGAFEVAPGRVLGVLARKVGIAWGTEPTFQETSVVWNIRMPRVLLAAVAGATYAVAGVVLQGTFRNRLADPHLLGIGQGAALGGVIGALAGGAEGAVAGATVTGLLTGLVVRSLGKRRAGEQSRFVLTGVALGLALTAWVGFIVFAGDQTRVPPIDFWLLGSLAGASWRILGTTTIVAGLGVAGLMGSARILDLFSLGESDARRLGVDVDMTTAVLLMAVGGITGAAVGSIGVVVFVGLLVPHLVRRLVGPSHRPLLTGSAAGGALFMILADLLARTAVSPIEIPVGLVTAALGGPFFIWLVRRPEIPGA
jgi:iron complex transport system permease protein